MPSRLCRTATAVSRSEIFSEADLDSQSPIFPFNYSPVKRASFDVSEDGAKWGGRSS